LRQEVRLAVGRVELGDDELAVVPYLIVLDIFEGDRVEPIYFRTER